MPSVVNDSCIKCKACASVCPVDAFHECETQLVADADEKFVKFNAEQAKVCPGAND